MGAVGIMVPMVESAEQARTIVASAKYPPRAGPTAGPMTTVMPKNPCAMARSLPVKFTSSIDWESGTMGAPKAPWATR